jgi:hypothetical protein
MFAAGVIVGALGFATLQLLVREIRFRRRGGLQLPPNVRWRMP